jgi:RNA polymerase sigma factor (sigma-70 family)
MIDMCEVSTISVTHPLEQNITRAVRDYGKRLFGFIRGRVNTDEDAEDILQDVWYQLSSVEDLEQIQQLGAWLFTVTRNKLTDMYRRQKTQSLDLPDLRDSDGEFNFKEILLADDSTPETEHLKAFFWQELFAALEELPEPQRQVFIWNELEDLTFQEIAERTGENIKTLISRKRYAVMHLRDRLRVLYDDITTQ